MKETDSKTPKAMQTREAAFIVASVLLFAVGIVFGILSMIEEYRMKQQFLQQQETVYLQMDAAKTAFLSAGILILVFCTVVSVSGVIHMRKILAEINEMHADIDNISRFLTEDAVCEAETDSAGRT